jgi:hypothetical protein
MDWLYEGEDPGPCGAPHPVESSVTCSLKSGHTGEHEAKVGSQVHAWA